MLSAPGNIATVQVTVDTTPTPITDLVAAIDAAAAAFINKANIASVAIRPVGGAVLLESHHSFASPWTIADGVSFDVITNGADGKLLLSVAAATLPVDIILLLK